jgi:hypothetical protein
MKSRNMKKNPKFKIVKDMKFTSKTRFNHLLLSITLYDTYWKSQLDFLYLSIQHNNKGHREKKSNSNNALLLLLGLSPKIIIVLVYRSIFLTHFTMLAPCALYTSISLEFVLELHYMNWWKLCNVRVKEWDTNSSLIGDKLPRHAYLNANMF